jgi:hypothetical protein
VCLQRPLVCELFCPVHADFLPPQIFQAIAALGFFVVLISLLGCWGAYYEIKWILIVYAIILFALLFAQLAAGIVVFVRRDQAPMYVEEAWASTPNALRVEVQNLYSCCGLFAFNDSTSGRPCPGARSFCCRCRCQCYRCCRQPRPPDLPDGRG